MKVLIVEDEFAVAMLVEDAVLDSGNEVVRIATNIKDAMAAVARDDFDVALLDLNLNGQKAHALPVTLSARGKPFAFVTGYGDTGVLSAFSGAPVVTKPFRTGDIWAVLEKLGTMAS